MTEESDKALLTALRRAAMDLLARREHSRAELDTKLARKFPDLHAHISPVLDQLEQDALLSDERFAEAYTRYRRNRGVGPLLIRQELAGKGISTALIGASVDEGDEQWRESLKDVLARKSRGLDMRSLDNRTRQKLFRFALSRGFSAHDISRALRSDLEL
ncbi:MAG: regulatory protein RecX [Pseudomonadales bacterium]|nr:regulatory protein RecX [Pseudomonadales bacterium]MCP5358041.1 regulatory protein RecX [Pseudomonadales bacterium]